MKRYKKATYIHTHTHWAHHPLFWIYCYFKDSFFPMQHHKWMWIVIVVAYPLFNVFVLYVRLFASLSTKMMWCHQSFPSWIPTYLMNVCIHFFPRSFNNNDVLICLFLSFFAVLFLLFLFHLKWTEEQWGTWKGKKKYSSEMCKCSHT